MRSLSLVSVVTLLATASVNADAGCNFTPHGPATTYALCQKQTRDPLSGCPPGTILVSQTDSKAKFKTIQSAIESLRDDHSHRVILIAPGNYTEQLNVTRQGPLTLLGTSDYPFDRKPYGNTVNNANQVRVFWASANHDSTGQSLDNALTSVLTVAPTLNASLTGSGPTGFPVPADTPFGNRNFRAYNIDFLNIAYSYSDGPALSASISYANAGFYGCGLYSYQDTLYVGKLGNAYFYDSIIAGQTDFLYGFGTLYVEESTLALRNCGGGITAWKGTNTTFPNKYGAYISDSQVLAANSSVAPEIVGKCALGRPWNSQHRSVFMDTYLDASINPQGYIIWSTSTPRVDNYTFMAVYDDRGPGWTPQTMAASNVTIVLDDAGVKPYRYPKDVFQKQDGKFGHIKWIDQSVLNRP